MGRVSVLRCLKFFMNDTWVNVIMGQCVVMALQVPL